MAEPRLLKLQSPAYGEPIFYKWPLINTVIYTFVYNLSLIVDFFYYLFKKRIFLIK